MHKLAHVATTQFLTNFTEPEGSIGLVTDLWVGKRLSSVLQPLSEAGFGGSKLRRFFGRRDGRIPDELVNSLPNFAFTAGLDKSRRNAVTDYWARRNARFCGLVARRGFGDATLVYAFNAAGLEIFQAAKREGLRTVLDQTAAPWRWNSRLLREEMERWPDWEEDPVELDKSGRITQREEAEWELADHVVCGSEFCLSAFRETSGKNGSSIVVRFPYTNRVRTSPDSGSESHVAPRRFRVLFLGTLQLRKGIQYLYETAGLLAAEDIEFRAVGPSSLSERANRVLARRIELMGAVPRSEVARHYAWADVLVLPTLSEGAANVVVEAMAAGLPVVTTEAAGSAIRDGVDGFIVAPRDCGTMATRIMSLATDLDLRRRMSRNALATVSETNRDHRYIDTLLRIVDDES